MTGELFEIEENKLRVVSLDGHRISIRYIEMKITMTARRLLFPARLCRK